PEACLCSALSAGLPDTCVSGCPPSCPFVDGLRSRDPRAVLWLPPPQPITRLQPQNRRARPSPAAWKTESLHRANRATARATTRHLVNSPDGPARNLPEHPISHQLLQACRLLVILPLFS